MKKSYASTILTVVSALGVIATAVVAVKNAQKARQILERAEWDKGEELTTGEKIKAAAPAYIPTAIVGATTIACIFGANVLNKQTQASMASAYALLDASYKEYRRKVEEIYGEGSDDDIIQQIAVDEYEKELIDEIPEGELLFFDYASMQYFHSTIEEVLQKVEMEDGMECYIITTPFDTPRVW